MKTSTAVEEKRGDSAARKPARAARFSRIHWGYLLIAAIPVGLTSYYLTEMAPGLFPMPEGMKVPFPTLTQALEPVCTWCGSNPEWVFGTGAVLLFAGLVMRIHYARYYLTLALAVTMTL